MKIVQAIGWYYPESLGGTEVYVAGLCRRLVAAGHEVQVAAPDPASDSERTYNHEGICVYRYPIPAEPTRAECQAAVPVRGSEYFHSWLRRERPDVLHVHTFVTGLGLFELKAARAAGVRVIVTTHAASLGYVCQRGTMMRWGQSLCDGVCQSSKCAACELQHRGLSRPLASALAHLPKGFSRRAARLPGRFGSALGMRYLIVANQTRQREMLETVDRFVLLTQSAMDMAAANGGEPEKLALNRLGLSQEDVSHKADPARQPAQLPITVGYLGRFDPIKGVTDLARAFASLPRDLPIRLEFRGPVNTPQEAAMLARLRDILRDDSRVVFAPAVSPQEVPAVLSRYDVLCCPAVCLEGGPTVAIEAHASGTPVIGTRIGGLAELVEDGVNGRLTSPGRWRELADVLKSIVEEPVATIDQWRTRLPPARTMDEISADYVSLYEQVTAP